MIKSLEMVDITCPHCQFAKRISEDKIPPRLRWIRCPRCGNRFEYKSGDAFGKTEKRHPAPWERRAALGLWKGIMQTVTSVAFSPRATFSTLALRGGWREPLAFGLLVGSISSMFASFWEFVLAVSGIVQPWWSTFISLNVPIVFLFLILLSPLFVALDLLVSTVIIHSLLRLVGDGGKGFEGTFRVVAYSQATMVWSIIPVIGRPIGWAWRTIVQIIGLKEAHGASYLRIGAALFIPVVLIMTLVAVAAFFLTVRL